MSIRNSECICGSGKKFKRCCMNGPDIAKQLIFESQFNFLANDPVCINCRGENPSQMGMYCPIGKKPISYALCESCASQPDINDKILELLK
jgi:SEC-C motif